MSVTDLQKQTKNLQTLKAARRQYTRAKHYRVPRLVITYLLSIGLPIILFLMSSQDRDFWKPYFAGGGACWLVIAYFIGEHEKKRIKEAAAIQELFDTEVYKIDWNHVLVTQPTPGDIISLAKNFEGPVDDRWHGDLSAIPAAFDVAVAQRNTLEWDWQLRRWYAQLVKWILYTLFGIEVILGLANHVTLEDAMLLLVLPSISVYILGYREYKEHKDNVEGRKNVQAKLDQYIAEKLKEKKAPDKAKLRQFQDATYILRKCPAVVPDFVSKWRHEWLQTNNNARIEEFVKKITDRFKK